MLDQGSAFGFVVYLLEVFLPGVGIGDLMGAWRETWGLAERVGTAFGVGLAFDTVVLLVRTSGLQLGGVQLRGIDYSTVYFILAVGAVAVLASAVMRRRAPLWVRPTRIDAAVACAAALAGAVVALHLQKYPIFPFHYSSDFVSHVQLASSLLSGVATSVSAGILYYGIHFQLASALLLVGGNSLVTVRETMALLVLFSPFLVFAASQVLLDDRKASLAVASIYSLGGAVWFFSVFDAGLFPNFFGILMSLLLIVAYLRVATDVRSPGAWVLFVMVMVAAYFSHYTFVTLLPAVVLFPLVRLRTRGQLKGYLVPSLVLVAPAIAGLAAFPNLVGYMLHLAAQGGGELTVSTSLGALFGGVPVVSFMADEVYYDIGFALLVALAAYAIFKGYRSRKAYLFVPVVWFVSLLVAAPDNISAWRFSFEALVPLLILSGYGLASLTSRGPQLKKRSIRRTDAHKFVTAGVVVLFILVVAGGWGYTVLADSANAPQASAGSQQSIYAAMLWLKANASSGSGYLCVSNEQFLYSRLFAPGSVTFSYIDNQSSAVAYAKGAGDGYIIVTYVTTLALPPVPQAFPWNTFHQSANLSLVYHDSYVEIFKVA